MSVSDLRQERMSLGVPGIEMELPRMRPVIVDDEQAEATLAGGEQGDRVVVLIAQERYADAAEAVTEARLLDPRNVRLRILDTDVIRWNGDTDRAVRRLRRILEEVEGTDDEAAVQHQLGACFYSLGDVHAAATRFRQALTRREAAGASGPRTESSRRCHALAQAALD